MTLDTGLFCVFQVPGSPAANDRSGLPGVRVSLPPGPVGRPDAISISTFREDGWMNGGDSAALVRVSQGPAQILVTVYQAPSAPPEAAPRLQVMRLGPGADGQAVAGHPRRQGSPALRRPMLSRGACAADRRCPGQDWRVDWPARQPAVDRGVQPDAAQWREAVGHRVPGGAGTRVDVALDRGGKFCGSRGMALPLLGLKMRLKGDVSKTHECSYSATFVDGSSTGPVAAGETCEAESLAALESFQLVIRRKGKEPAPAKAPRKKSR